MLRDIVSTHSTWTEWIGRVRTEYATRFGMVRREVLDEDGRPRTAWVPCDAACPPARTDAEEVRYETCVLDLIEEVDARSGYELAQWRQLGEAATSRSQRVIVETMLGAYCTRAGEERAAWGRERAAVQREAFDRLSGDEVRAEMIRSVCDELPHGVGGRTEAQWRARLAQALERRRREVREASAQQRSGELHAAKDSEERASAMSGVAHDEAQALAWALPALVVDALRDAGAPQWDAFVDRARAERVRFLGAPSAFGAATTFLQVLDGFEAMVRVIGGDGVARATPNPIASADVVLEALFWVRAVRAGEESTGDTTSAPMRAPLKARGRGACTGEWEKTPGWVVRFATMCHCAGARLCARARLARACRTRSPDPNSSRSCPSAATRAPAPRAPRRGARRCSTLARQSRTPTRHRR